VNTNDLTEGLHRIVDDVSAYYLLGYYSTNTKANGSYRRIQVKVKSPGVSVRARRGYFAPKTAEMAAAAPLAPAAAPGPSLVDEAFGRLSRLRPSTELFTYGIARGGAMAVAVEIASGQTERGLWTTGADVDVAVADASGAPVGMGSGRIEPATRGALIRVPVGTAAGPWRVTARVTSVDARLEDHLEVAADEGALLGAPLLFRGTPSASSPLRAVADFQFRRTERLHVEWATARVLDRREARLLGRNGQPLPVPVGLTERDAGGQTLLAADLHLAPLGPGDYAIEVTAGSGADTERSVVAIRVR
jgi:hypothetical protein